MAVALRRALLSLHVSSFHRPPLAFVSVQTSKASVSEADRSECNNGAESQEELTRLSPVLPAEVPSSCYTLAPPLAFFHCHWASFHHSAFHGATQIATSDSSRFSQDVPSPIAPSSAVVLSEGAGTPMTKNGLWRGQPIKQLTVGLQRIGGRNNTGKITVWHRGGGAKRSYRVIDFKRRGDLVTDMPAIVQRLEYDPNRNAHIALIRYTSGHVSYILAPEGLQAGNAVVAGPNVPIKPGNALPLGNIPRGTVIHNIELTPGRGGQLVRAAGASAQLIGQVERYSQVRLQSGEMRMILATCMATVGTVSNSNYHNIRWGKAGKSRWLGWRPTVRGVAMNPIDHPHGGGEGKTSGGRKSSMSPWAKPAKGGKTRNKKKPSTRLIMSRRKKATER